MTKLSGEMTAALRDMSESGPRKPTQTGFYGATYEALVSRGLAVRWFHGSYKITPNGRAAAREATNT